MNRHDKNISHISAVTTNRSAAHTVATHAVSKLTAGRDKQRRDKQ